MFSNSNAEKLLWMSSSKLKFEKTYSLRVGFFNTVSHAISRFPQRKIQPLPTIHIVGPLVDSEYRRTLRDCEEFYSNVLGINRKKGERSPICKPPFLPVAGRNDTSSFFHRRPSSEVRRNCGPGFPSSRSIGAISSFELRTTA